MSDPYGSYQKPSPYGDAPFAGQPRPPYLPPPARPPMQQPYGGYGPPTAYPPARRAPDRRPRTVVAAALIAILSSGASALVCLAGVVVTVAARGWTVSNLASDSDFDDVDPGGFTTFLSVTFAVLLVLSLAAVALGVLVLWRSNAARIALVVLAALTVLLSLVTITAIVPVLTLVGAIATIVLLFVGGANAWFGRKPTVVPYGVPTWQEAPARDDGATGPQQPWR